MNRIKSLVAMSAFSLLILGLPAIASAQWNGGYGGNNNGGYYGNGGYNIKSNVKSLKNQAKRFEDAVDRYDDQNDNRNNRGGYGGWGGGYGNNRNSDQLENLADQFKNAADKLEDKYGNGRNLGNSADEARRVLDIASQIDREMYNTRGNGVIQNQWNAIRQDLNMIANAYGYNGYNNGNPNRNNRNNRNGNWRNNIPFPLPF